MLKSIIAKLTGNEFLAKLLVSTIILYFYKTAFWPLTYLFVFSYLLLTLIIIIRFDWNFKLKRFIHIFLPPIVLALIMMVTFVFNFEMNTAIFKDFLLLVVLFSIYYFLFLNDNTFRNDIPLIFTINFVLILTSLICIINLIFIGFSNLIPVQIAEKLKISNGATIANDYNFFTLFIIFGLIILNYKKSITEKSFLENSKYLKYALNILFIISIMISSSRRGLVVFLLLMTLALLNRLRKHLKESARFRQSKFTWSIITFFIISVLMGFAIYEIIPKQKITVIAYRYATLLGLDDYKSVEKFLWERDPSVPLKKETLIDGSSLQFKRGCWTASSPGTTLSYTDTPYGFGVKLLKTGEPISFSLFYVGPQIIYYAEHTYKISFKVKFLKGDFDSFYLGWWADDGGKGISNTLVLDKKSKRLQDGWYSCEAEYTFIDNHVGLVGFINSVADNTEFILSDFELSDNNYNPKLPRYEFEYKGEKDINAWLDEVNAPWDDINLINNGDFSHGMAFWKYSANELKINIEEINKKKCALISRGNGDGGDWSLLYSGRNLEFYANDEYQLSCKIFPIIPKSIPFNTGFWVDEGDGYRIALDYEISPLDSGWLELRTKYRFKKNHGNLFFPINSQKSNSSFYITDLKLVNLSKTQYQTKPTPKKTELISPKIDNLDVGRISRIQFAEELWKSEYTSLNKIFGHGFDYYEWYMKKYSSPTGIHDYPHNPFITIMLYSGVLGLIAYLWLLYRTTFLYYKNRKEYGILFICYLITFFFSFFSGSSPFDPPIMGFFMLLPFFINHLQKNSTSSDLK